MFWNKKKSQELSNQMANINPNPVWIKNQEGQICGVKTTRGVFTIKTYSGLMMGTPNKTVMYMFNQNGDRVAWDIRSNEELMDVVNEYMKPFIPQMENV